MSNYYVVTNRVVKYNTGATDKFAPRTANRESWAISGPYQKKSWAERASMLALGTHTCLSATVTTEEILREYRGNYLLEQEIHKALKLSSQLVENA